MNTVTFKQFISDYEKYYNEKLTVIRTESDMDEVIDELYNVDELHYEIDYDNKIIGLY